MSRALPNSWERPITTGAYLLFFPLYNHVITLLHLPYRLLASERKYNMRHSAIHIWNWFSSQNISLIKTLIFRGQHLYIYSSAVSVEIRRAMRYQLHKPLSMHFYILVPLFVLVIYVYASLRRWTFPTFVSLPLDVSLPGAWDLTE